MKSFYALFIAILLSSVLPWALGAQNTVFYRNLSLGDRGADVLVLQKILNQNAYTKIADSGAGSPGLETEYFGNLTKKAVIRYQELYKSEILSPTGLKNGTGFVGPSTIKKLSGTALSIKVEGKTAETVSPTTSNDIDVFISQLRQLNPELIAKNINWNEFEVSIRQNATSSEYTKRFWDELLKDTSKTSLNSFKNFLNIQPRTLLAGDQNSTKIILNKASKSSLAQAGLLYPFGGPALYTYPCTCSSAWLIYVGPPSYRLLTYIPGTQAYLSYNLPVARYALGKYATTPPACYMYIGSGCAPITTFGTITSIVGSSK